MALFSRRFAELIERQLNLFASDCSGELAAIDVALTAHHAADAESAQDTFGDLQDRIDWAAEELIVLRDTYATTLEHKAAADYERAFEKAVRRRFPMLGDAVATEDIG